MNKSEKAIHFSSAVLALIKSEPNFEVSIQVGQWLANFLWHNYCGLYRLDELEEILLKKIPFETVGDIPPSLKEEIHVATEVYPGGGHTPLMSALIHHLPSKPDVLLTRPASEKTSLKILKISSESLNIVQDGNVKNRIFDIFQKLSSYKKIVLHIHADDVPCAIALRILKMHRPEIDISLVNHSDHSFSVALGIVDRVFEISAYGWTLRHAKGLEHKSSFMGIPIKPLDSSSDSLRGGNLVLSGGASYKFKPTEGKSLPRILKSVLSENKNLDLIIVGPKKTDWWWWLLSLRFIKNLTIMAHMPRDAYLIFAKKCHIYIDSFPVAGGTALPEALINGAYILGMRTGVWGGSYADTLRSQDEKNFLSDFKDLMVDGSDLQRKQDTIRQKTTEFHSIDSIVIRVEAARVNKSLINIPDEFLQFKPEIFFESIWRKQRTASFPRLPKKMQHQILLRIMNLYVSYFSVFNLNLLKSYIKFFKNKCSYKY